MTFLNRVNLFHFFKELLWLTITAMITYAVLYPVTSKIDFIYWKVNAFFVFLGLTYFRWSIMFKSLPFLKPAWLRFILFTVNLSLMIYLFQQVLKFVALADNFYTEDFGFPKVILYDDVKQELFKYLYNELIFSGTASVVMLAAFEVRLIISYWQYYKHQASRMLED
jgi:hypothetical protein